MKRYFRGWPATLALALLTAGSVVAIATADIVTVNDLVTGGDATKTVGQTGTVKLVLTNLNGDGGANGCNTAGGNPVTFNVTSSQPSKVALASSTVTFTDCGDAHAQTVGYTALAAGSSVISASYASGGKAGTQTASAYNTADTLTVTVSPPPDSSAPDISYQLAGTEGDNGWYTSSVGVDWTVTDNESAISSMSGCTDTTVSTDGVHSLTCTATSSGGTSSKTAEFKIDQVAPGVQCGAADGNWSAIDVSIACTATDGGSGVSPASDESFVLSTNVPAGTETANALTGTKTVSDAAGHTTTAGPIGGNKVDKKAPAISCDTPAPTFTLGQSANVTGTATDGGSGPASATVSKPADTSSVGGSKSVSLDASDGVGNSSSANCSYSVAFGFSGLSAPIDRPNILNVSKAGQALPLKWRLTDANGDPVTTLSSVKVLVSDMGCASGTSADLVEEYAAGSSGLQNLGDGYYQFNWKSPTSYANSCKSLRLDLGEGSARTVAYVQFKK